MKCAVFAHAGIGDALTTLTLSNNLHREGWQIDTYQDTMIAQLQSWFPHLLIKKFPTLDKIDNLLIDYDRIFVFHSDDCPTITKLMALKNSKGKVTVIHPSFSKRYKKQPFYQEGQFNRRLSVVENLKNYCSKVLHLKNPTKHNGIIPPEGLTHHKYANRVIIHPTSSRLGRSWGENDFVKLALHLKSIGMDPKFVMSVKEKLNWEHVKECEIITFPTLDLLASYIYESGAFIGNDSGIGHLASCLGIRTLTIARSKRCTRLWRPGWAKGLVVYPNPLYPNISKFRYRDRNWKSLIPLKKVLKAFDSLIKKA